MRINNASFQEKRRVVTKLGKEIIVIPEVVGGRRIPVVTIVNRFNEPNLRFPSPKSSVIPTYTPACAVHYLGRFELTRKWYQFK